MYHSNDLFFYRVKRQESSPRSNLKAGVTRRATGGKLSSDNSTHSIEDVKRVESNLKLDRVTRRETGGKFNRQR